MEHAPLRPVPSRPAGPIEPGAALRELTGWLPSLAPEAAHALALAVLAERPRDEVAASVGVGEAALGDLLAAARKELRRTVAPLGGSGWCERAERLISDRLDGALAGAEARTLDVHLRNCPRCVEHERRLVQATDTLVGTLGGAPGPPPALGVPGREETVVTEITPEEPAAPDQSAAAPGEGAPVEEAPADDRIEEGAGPSGAPSAVSVPAEIPSADAPAPPSPDEIAAAAEVLVAVRTRRQIAAAIVWNSLVALAVLLALATIALTVAGILGAEL